MENKTEIHQFSIFEMVLYATQTIMFLLLCKNLLDFIFELYIYIIYKIHFRELTIIGRLGHSYKFQKIFYLIFSLLEYFNNHCFFALRFLASFLSLKLISFLDFIFSFDISILARKRMSSSYLLLSNFRDEIFFVVFTL